MNEAAALMRGPRAGADIVLARGRLGGAAALVALATLLSAASVWRYAQEVAVEDVMFGPGRSPAVDALIALLGRDLTSVVLHLFERSWGPLLVAAALAPLFTWLLGATAIHAAARLGGLRQPFLPMLILFGFATGVTRPLADLGALAFGRTGASSALAELAGAAALAWLAVLAWRGVQAHYGVSGGRALVVLTVALVAFYLVPLLLILAAVVAILVAAIVLEYFSVP